MSIFEGVKAVYFDLDDTLCAYWDASKAALKTAFQEEGPAEFTPEEMIRHWASAFRIFSKEVKEPPLYAIYLKKGEPTRTEQMRRALLEVGIDDPKMARAIGDRYAFERDRNLALFHDAQEVIEYLYGDYPLGIITNGPADIQNQEIDTLGIRKFFPHIFIEGELGFGKPNPEVFRLASESVGKLPHEILMVGNSYKHDIVGAAESGWKTAWVRRPSDVPPSATGSAKPEEMPEGGLAPDLTFGALSELKSHL